ncbi:MAG: PEP-CTERM sorting domain-containing protein, partial [Terriglobia bacterium]
SDDEINVGQYIYLNLSQLAAMSILGGNLELGSVQVGEVGKVCATAAVGTPGTLDCVTYTGTLLTNGDITQGVTWSSTDDILSITATSNNVLVGEGLTVTTPAPAPEPGSFLLFGLALAGLAVMGVRRKSAFAGR